MPAPRRMNAPRRMGARERNSAMFPHAVTLYNVAVETDKATFASTVVNHITILRGVLLDASKAVNVRESGLVGADAVNLYIPFGVEAVDAVTGKAKQYMPPRGVLAGRGQGPLLDPGRLREGLQPGRLHLLYQGRGPPAGGYPA